METSFLRDLVSLRIGQRWESWSRAHPHLAAAIDRVRLIDSVITSLRDDPEFVRAMEQAQTDENKLQAATQLIALAERLIARFLPL